MPKRNMTRLVGAGQRVYARLSADVAREIARALQAEHRHHGVTRADLARLIGRDKSFVTRKLSGSQNVEIRTIAALLGALGYELDVRAHRIDTLPGTTGNAVGGDPVRDVGSETQVTGGLRSAETMAPQPAPAALVVGKSHAFAQ